MEVTISTGSLRRQAGECLARVSNGDTFVILRHGQPVAILRPAQTRDVWRRGRASATVMWRNLRDLMAAARHEPVLITWYGAGTAVLEQLPSGLHSEAES